MERYKINEFGKKPLSLEARRFLIISDIAKGEKYSTILHKYVEEWKLSIKSVEKYISDAMEFMRSETTKNNLISMNMERLDGIITDSMKDGDRRNAIKAIDTQNKLAGGYTEKLQIEGDSEITLNFDLD